MKKFIIEYIDFVFFVMSYDYVGEVSEIVVYLWFYSEFMDNFLSFIEVVEIFVFVSK